MLLLIYLITLISSINKARGHCYRKTVGNKTENEKTTIDTCVLQLSILHMIPMHPC